MKVLNRYVLNKNAVHSRIRYIGAVNKNGLSRNFAKKIEQI